MRGGDHHAGLVPERVPGARGVGEIVMKQVLFEEDGAFRVGTDPRGGGHVASGGGGARQALEGEGGRRSCCGFDGQALGAFMPQRRSSPSARPEVPLGSKRARRFGFDELAREYFDARPRRRNRRRWHSPACTSPMYFYKRGKGRYRGRAEESLQARRSPAPRRSAAQQEQVDAWAGEPRGRSAFPRPSRKARRAALQARQDGARVARARRRPRTAAGRHAAALLARAGALAGPEDFFLRRFAFEFFPARHRFRSDAGTRRACRSFRSRDTAAFSIDDEETTEIDDAFSMARSTTAACAWACTSPRPPCISRARMRWRRWRASGCPTVCFPAAKITMLPQDAVDRATLAAGRRVARRRLLPRPSIPRASRCIGRIAPRGGSRVADNLRSGRPGPAPERGRGRGRNGRRAARRRPVHSMEARAVAEGPARGRGREATAPDYTFRVDAGRVSIEPRRRGTPVDTLVAELMIHVNSTWEAARRARLRCDVPQPGGRQDAHGGRARLAPVARCVALRMDELAPAPLQRPRQPAPARGAAARRGAAYTKDDLASAARDFETAYEAYAEHQRLLERYWTVLYIQQEGIADANASVIRDDLVRIEGLPLVCRAVGLPACGAGRAREGLTSARADPWEAAIFLSLRRKISTYNSGFMQVGQPSQDALVSFSGLPARKIRARRHACRWRSSRRSPSTPSPSWAWASTCRA